MKLDAILTILIAIILLTLFVLMGIYDETNHPIPRPPMHEHPSIEING